MKDRQWGSLFFSILDTRKVINLVLDLFNIVQNDLQPPTPGAPPCPGRVQPDLHQLSGARLCGRHHQVRRPQRRAVPTTTGSQDSFLLASVFSKVIEVLRKSASAKGLFYLSLDGVQVPEELLNDKAEDAILSKMRRRYNMYIGGSTTTNTLTSVIQ